MSQVRVGSCTAKRVCIYHSKKASSLVEVLVSIGIVALFLVASVSAIINSQFLESYSKHRLQAMYVAGQLIEQERRLTFANIVSIPSAAITLDSKGTYNTSADDFFGNAIITVTNLENNPTFRKQLKVEINWQENMTTGKVTMREYYSTIIVNETVPN